MNKFDEKQIKDKFRLLLANEELEWYSHKNWTWTPSRLSGCGEVNPIEIVFSAFEIEKGQIIDSKGYFIFIKDDIPYVLRLKEL